MILFRQSAMLHDSKPSNTEGFIFFKLVLEVRFGLKKRQSAGSPFWIKKKTNNATFGIKNLSKTNPKKL